MDLLGGAVLFGTARAHRHTPEVETAEQLADRRAARSGATDRSAASAPRHAPQGSGLAEPVQPPPAPAQPKDAAAGLEPIGWKVPPSPPHCSGEPNRARSVDPSRRPTPPRSATCPQSPAPAPTSDAPHWRPPPAPPSAATAPPSNPSGSPHRRHLSPLPNQRRKRITPLGATKPTRVKVKGRWYHSALQRSGRSSGASSQIADRAGRGPARPRAKPATTSREANKSRIFNLMVVCLATNRQRASLWERTPANSHHVNRPD